MMRLSLLTILASLMTLLASPELLLKSCFYTSQVGLISDEKLVDLLDFALSADTVNTVKSLREIMESGVEPLALMSQLATVITDVLAGTYNFTKERHRRKFFRRRPCEALLLFHVKAPYLRFIYPSFELLNINRDPTS